MTNFGNMVILILKVYYMYNQHNDYYTPQIISYTVNGLTERKYINTCISTSF